MATANLLPTEVAAHECIEHFTLPGTARSNPPGNLSAHSVRVTPVRGHRRGLVRARQPGSSGRTLAS
jgi:hypothetical protein